MHFLEENLLISIKASLKFAPKGTVKNIPADNDLNLVYAYMRHSP